jgi:hypothetical protein
MAGKAMDTGALVAQTKMGETVNSLPLAIGRYDEVDEANTNTSWQTAQELRYPLTVNGRLPFIAPGFLFLELRVMSCLWQSACHGQDHEN